MRERFIAQGPGSKCTASLTLTGCLRHSPTHEPGRRRLSVLPGGRLLAGSRRHFDRGYHSRDPLSRASPVSGSPLG
jgi:hypothetical protein